MGSSVGSNLVIAVVAIIVFLIAIGVEGNKTCVVPISSKDHFLQKWPLFFKPNGDLYLTVTEKIDNEDCTSVRVDSGAEVLVSCGPNYIKNSNNQEVLNVVCNGATGKFRQSEKDWNMGKLNCDLRVIEEVLSSVDGCTNNEWTSVNFGFVHPTEKVTYLLGEACYDTNVGVTRFAHVKMGKNKDSNFLSKKEKSYLTSNRHPSSSYKIELFRGLHFDVIYSHIREKLHLRHAPHLYLAKFIDENLLSSPQFQSVKKLSWNYFVAHEDLDVFNAIKRDIRTFSEKIDLDVFVGSHGVSVLQGLNELKMEVYLQEDRFPMPELIWLLVKHDEKAIAFAVYNKASNEANTINLQHSRSEKPICQSVCEKVTWLKDTKSAANKDQLLVCCSYADFQNSITEIPLWTNIKEMLL